MLYRCESCQTVTIYPSCRCGQTVRALTPTEAAAYVQHGHAAFRDLAPVLDERGGIVRYDAR